MNGVKKDEFWKEDSEGRLKRIFQQGEDRVDLKDHLMLRYALQRRGLAMDMARVMRFATHEKIVAFLFEELAREALPGYSSISLEQVRRADKEIFNRLAELTRGGLIQTHGDDLPLDRHVEGVISEPRIAVLLLPLQSRGSGSDGSHAKRGGDEIQRLREEVKRLRHSDSKPEKGRGKEKGKGKGKGEANNRDKGYPMPKELIGMNNTVDGEPVCFNYNTSRGCQTGVDRCPKGVHKCAFPKCGANHPLKHCPLRAM
jgi:hypothetical protein